MATRGEGSVPSAARALSELEISDLVELAKSLPDDWCVSILPPHGQVAISPIAGRPVHHRCWSASRRWGAIRHERSRSV